MNLVWYDLEEEKRLTYFPFETRKVQSQKCRSKSQNRNTAVIKGGLMMMYYSTSYSYHSPDSKVRQSGEGVNQNRQRREMHHIIS
jgi:hypothetical protein